MILFQIIFAWWFYFQVQLRHLPWGCTQNQGVDLLAQVKIHQQHRIQSPNLQMTQSEGILAGELKHGPLALVDPDLAMIMVITRDPVYSKCMNALQQVQLAQDMFVTTWWQMLPKVTARGGRPVLICEEGDAETQRLNPDNCLTIPHTVDCLQVGNLSCFSAGTLWLWTVVTIIVNPTWCRGQMLLLLCCREFSALFHYSYSLTTWPSSSEYSHDSFNESSFFYPLYFPLQGLQRWLPAKPGQVGDCGVNQELQMAFLNFFCDSLRAFIPFCTKTQRKRTMKRRILEIPTLHIARQVLCWCTPFQ